MWATRTAAEKESREHQDRSRGRVPGRTACCDEHTRVRHRKIAQVRRAAAECSVRTSVSRQDPNLL